jgi:ubiquinone/menaquinone biosynthesis C-methylase UbiE
MEGIHVLSTDAGEAELRAMNRATWSYGEYDRIAVLLEPGAAALVDRLVERQALAAATRHLDVATGNGNVALLVATHGARVTGLDLTPAFFAQARQRATAAGLTLDLVEGDVEKLPYPDAHFDLVTSTYGIQFAPGHTNAANEIARVCRPGGTVGMCNWTPRSWTAHFSEILASYFPPPPPFAGQPMRWGDEAYLLRLLGGAFTLRTERRQLWYPFTTGEDLVAYFEPCFGPLLAAQRTISPRSRYAQLRAELVAASDEFVVADARGTGVPVEYLLITGERR